MWLSEIFDRAFQSIQKNYRTWLLVAAISSLLSLPTVLTLPPYPSQEISPAGYASGLLSLVLNILIAPGLFAMGLHSAKGEKITLDLIIKKVHLAWKLFGFSVLYGIAVAAGLIALVIPGVYLMIRFGFAPLIIIENEKVGVFDAMKRSGELAKGKYLNIAFNGLVLLLVGMTVAMIVSVIVSLAIPSNQVGWLLAKEALLILPSSVVMPLFYVGFSVIYRQVVASGK